MKAQTCRFGMIMASSLGKMLDKAKNEERFAQIFTELGRLEIPVQGVFYNGQLWDARALVLKLVAGAKHSLILIDNWATPEVLDLFTKRRRRDPPHQKVGVWVGR